MPTRRQFLLASAATLSAPAAVARVVRAASLPTNTTNNGLAKFEPAKGCYIGAFIERDSTVVGSIPTFEEFTQKKHASYFTYVGYGRPFPAEWVHKVARNGAAPHIAFEPNDGLGEVTDSPYLRAFARDAARTKVPIFLRWASEMNGPWTKYGGNPDLYKAKFALVSKIFKEEAPNVAMVWTPFAEPAKCIPDYYPGDEWVDWVGMNIYSVYVHDGDPTRPSADEDPVAFLRTIYELYADRKPVHISEYAATIWCKGTGAETVDWAIGKATRFYDAIRDDFPRVKSVNWFCLDTVKAGLANNNYSIIANAKMLATYRSLVADKHFLSQVFFNPNEWNQKVKPGTTITGNLAFRQNDDDEIVNAAAIAATINEPWLRGLKNGDVVTDDLQLWAQLPVGFEATGMIWQVDGRTVALTNTKPFKVIIPRARFVEGEHRAKVTVMTTDGREIPSAEVVFEIQ